MINKQKIAVAMSGGVDSSVAALLLAKKGYQVIGLTMYLGSFSKASVQRARKVCQKLGIAHYRVNLAEDFARKIIKPFCSEYFSGRTPNPCIRCNETVKFGLLMAASRELGASWLASGHYVRLRQTKIKNTNKKNKIIYHLLKAKDKTRDQSYFLCRLNQRQLKYLVFPLGDLTKSQVQQIARKNNLPLSGRPESREICFIPKNDYREFLRKTCLEKSKPGQILDRKGKILGKHQGIAFYTIGQRKRLRISGPSPLYVIKIDKRKNAIIVAPEKDLYQKELEARNVNWISGDQPELPLKIKAQIRYRHKASASIVNRCFKSKVYSLKFKVAQRAITPGQSVVFYKGNKVLGGGIID